jgi:putative phage-type endonuclease
MSTQDIEGYRWASSAEIATDAGTADKVDSIEVHATPATHDVEQRSEEWFELRNGRITASRAGKLLRHSDKEALLVQLVRQKAGLPPTFQGNEATAYGTEAEPLARAAFEAAFGVKVTDVGFVTLGRLGASPDGIFDEHLLEIKCPYSRNIPDEPFGEHLAQVNFQLGVCQLEHAALWYWTPDDARRFDITFDQDLWERQFDAAYEILFELDAIEDPKAWLAERELPERTDDEWRNAELRYVLAKQAADDAAEGLESARQELLRLAPDGAKGPMVKVTWVTRAGYVSYRDLIKDQHLDDELVERYRTKPSRYVKVTVL